MAEVVKDAILATSPTVSKSLPGQIPAPAAQPAPKLPEQNVVSGGSFFGGAGQDVNTRTKALLEAVATGGKRGLDSFKQAETAIGDYRKQALGRAQSRAALIGGPEAQGFEAIADTQFGARQADLAQSTTAFTEDMARRGIAGKGALDQLRGILPILQAKTQKQIARTQEAKLSEAKESLAKDWEAKALGQAEIDEKTAADNLSTLDKDITRLESERAELEKPIKERSGRIGAIDKEIQKLQKEEIELSKAPALQGVGPRSTMKKLAERQTALIKERHALIKESQDKLKEWDSRNAKALEGRRAEREKFAGVTPETRAERARRIATEQLGVEAPLATGKINVKDTAFATKPPADDKTLITKAGLADKKELDTLRSTDVYQEFTEALPTLLETTTKEGVLQTLRQQAVIDGKFNTKLYNLLVTEFGNLFPTSASLRSQEMGTG